MPEILIEHPDFRPAVLYSHADHGACDAARAEEIIAAEHTRAKAQEACSPAHGQGVARWLAEEHHLAWLRPLAADHDRYGPVAPHDHTTSGTAPFRLRAPSALLATE